MSANAEKLQDAIGLVDDAYIQEAHGEEANLTQVVTAESGADGTVRGAVNENATTKAAEAQSGVRPLQAADVVVAAGKQPAKKRRSFALPLAAAACLVVALIGVFGVANLLAPKAEESAYREEPAVEVAGEVDSYDGEVTSMATESAADGAAFSGSLSTGTAKGLYGDEAAASAEALVLTAAEWNDNLNWPFFANLVNSGTVSFPSFGIDPRHRVKVNVTDGAGAPVRGQEVVLRDEGGLQLWKAKSGKDGAAYLFYLDGQFPSSVQVGDIEQSLTIPPVGPDDQQGNPTVEPVDEVNVVIGYPSAETAGLQVMFIMDTTGSMSDELAYLQKDFAAIAADVGAEGVTYSANFYRDEGDEYVTKTNGFTSDIDQVQTQLNDEYAAGGGDMPEAVAQILSETITENGQWRDDCSKVAFLVFDAPPHDGCEAELDAAVRNASERGIRLVPVVASNAARETELFGRALSICTGGTYVFLTDDSGVGDSHLEPIVGDYAVERLHDVIVRIIQESR